MELQDPTTYLYALRRPLPVLWLIDAQSLIVQCDYVSPSWYVSVQGDHTIGFSQKKQINPFTVLLSVSQVVHAAALPVKSLSALICSVKAKRQFGVPLTLT